MRDYGKVHTAIWSSTDFRGLTEDGRALALYLLTCPHATIAGVFRLPDGYVSEDMQWGCERVSEGFRDLLSKGFATRCEATKWVWVRRYLAWNPLENPNQRKAARKLAEQVPRNCAWRHEFLSEEGSTLGIQPLQNPSETVQQPLLNQEQEQEQEQKQEQEKTSPPGNVIGPQSDAQAGQQADQRKPVDPPAQPGADAPATPRGKRIADDWVLPRIWGAWAIAKYPHWTADIVRAIATTFHNHWKAKTGRDATKVDWQATWQNWCDSDITQRQYPKPRGADRSAEASRIADGARAILERRQKPTQEVIDA